MAVENAATLGQALVDAAVAAHEAGLDGDSETELYVLAEVLIPASIGAVIVAHPVLMNSDAIWVEPFCRVCGCTDTNACPDGCYWVEPDLCSSCVSRVPIVLDLSPRSVEAAP